MPKQMPKHRNGSKGDSNPGSLSRLRVRHSTNESPNSGGQQKRGKFLMWSNVIRKYMKEKQVKTEEAQDRRTWRLKT